MVIALCRCGFSLLLPAHPKFLSLGSSAGEEPATEDSLRNGMESRWGGLVLILSLCLGSYQGKAWG